MVATCCHVGKYSWDLFWKTRRNLVEISRRTRRISYFPDSRSRQPVLAFSTTPKKSSTLLTVTFSAWAEQIQSNANAKTCIASENWNVISCWETTARFSEKHSAKEKANFKVNLIEKTNRKVLRIMVQARDGLWPPILKCLDSHHQGGSAAG